MEDEEVAAEGVVVEVEVASPQEAIEFKVAGTRVEDTTVAAEATTTEEAAEAMTTEVAAEAMITGEEVVDMITGEVVEATIIGVAMTIVVVVATEAVAMVAMIIGVMTTEAGAEGGGEEEVIGTRLTLLRLHLRTVDKKFSPLADLEKNVNVYPSMYLFKKHIRQQMNKLGFNQSNTVHSPRFLLKAFCQRH